MIDADTRRSPNHMTISANDHLPQTHYLSQFYCHVSRCNRILLHPSFNVMSIVASRSTQEYVHSQYPLQRLDRALSRRNFTNTSPNLLPIHLHRTSSALAILTIVWNLDARCITHLTNLLIYHHIRYSLSINSHIFIVFGTS